jgi:iron complex outermembrane receptor protein
MYRVLPNLSVYASYSESFESNLGRDVAGNVFDPALSEQYEIGAKGSLAPGLQWSAAVFDLRKTNMTTRDLANPGFSVQTGEQRAKGVELELSGRVTSALRVHGAFSYLDSEIVRDNLFPVGNKLRMAPRHTARLWGEYAFAGAWQNWSASLGTTYVGERYTNLFNNNVIPSFVVWDAGVRYRVTKNDTLQLAIKNLTDRRYVEDALDTDQIYQGAPRSVSLRYTHMF